MENNTTTTLKRQMRRVLNDAMDTISDIQLYSTPLWTFLNDMDEALFDEYGCKEAPVEPGKIDISRCATMYLTVRHYKSYSWTAVNYAYTIGEKLEACHEALSKVFDQLKGDINNGQLIQNDRDRTRVE